MAQPVEYFTQFNAQRLKFFIRRIKDGRTPDSLKVEFPGLADMIDEAGRIAKSEEDENTGGQANEIC